MTVNREKLYEEIWAEPIIKVSKRYGVSDSYLVRICKRLNIPRPPAGYWAMLYAGIKAEQPKLPDAKPGDELEWVRDGLARRVLPEPPKAPALAPKKVRRKSQRPAQHNLLVGALLHFQNSRESSSPYLRPYKKLLPDLIVSKPRLDHGLKLINELFLQLEDQGHRVVVAPTDQIFYLSDIDEREKPRKGDRYPQLWRPVRSTVVYIGSVAIGLTVFEISEEIKHRYIKGEYIPIQELPALSARFLESPSTWTTNIDVPSGRFCLQAYSPYPGTDWKKQWREAKVGDLPKLFKSIISELENAAPMIAASVEEVRRLTEQRDREWEEEKKRRRLEEGEKRKALALKQSKDDLLVIIESWAEAKRIEEFFRDVEQRAESLNTENRQAILKLLHQARELIGDDNALNRFLIWKTPNDQLPT